MKNVRAFNIVCDYDGTLTATSPQFADWLRTYDIQVLPENFFDVFAPSGAHKDFHDFFAERMNMQQCRVVLKARPEVRITLELTLMNGCQNTPKILIYPQQNTKNISAFVDAASDGFWDWYIAEDYEYMSPRFWEILGFEPHEKKHHPSEWQALILPESLEIALDNFDKHVKTKGVHPFSQDVKYYHKDGSIVDILCRGKVIEWDEEGNPVHMVGTHTDITPIKKAQKELIKREKLFKSLFEHASIGIALCKTATFEIEDVNPRLSAILESTPKEYAGKTITKLWPTLFNKVAMDRLKGAKIIDEQYEINYTAPSGKAYELFIQLKNYDLDGGDNHLLIQVMDITEQKTFENMFLYRNNFMKRIFQNSPDFLFVKDEACRIMEANDAFLSLYPGKTKKDIIGTTTVESYDPDEAAAFLENDFKALREGSSEVYEKVQMPDGITRTLFTKKVRFEDANGNPFIMGLARDMTPMLSLVEELKQSNEDLEEFAHIASHDLREPLRGISNHVELLRFKMRGVLDTANNERIDRILNLAKDMSALIVDLLQISKVGSKELCAKETDLNQLLQRTLKSFPLLQEEGIEIKINNTLPTILCDAVRVGELFKNLINNAIKYNQSPKKFVEIGSYIEKGEPVFYVKDNGIGIDPVFHEEVFRLFKRLNSDKANRSGTGVGLTFVKKIVNRHNGKIWLESEPGKGATFFFTLGQEQKNKN